MSATLRLSWRENIRLSAGDEQASVESSSARFAVRYPRPEIVEAMRRLTPPGEDENLLAESVLAAGGTSSLAKWLYFVNGLRKRGLVYRSLYAGDKLLATVVPFDQSFAEDNGHRSSPAAAYRLSRFAYLRRDANAMVLESPLAHSRVVLHDPRVTMLLTRLTARSTVEQLATDWDETSREAVERLVDALVEECFVEPVNGDADDGEPSALEAWEFHDLLFHSRSRRGRNDAPCGGTFRLAHRPPPPAIRPLAATDDCPLHRPDLDQLKRDDPPLAAVQEARRSIREYADQPLSADELGEFLYRVARVKHQWQSDMSTHAGPVGLEFASRPYPSGGALYELEFYTAIGACQGLDAGLYRYDPLRHRLARVACGERDLKHLLDDAAASAGLDANRLQVLIVLAARFERIAWKYESIAYALVLKHVGVVYQTMYLAATAMGLAPCALGGGDSDVFARATANDYYRETSVGEFLLGSRKSVERPISQ